MSNIVITELRRTCDVAPAQWEGKTSDGLDVYIRIRHGNGGVGIGSTPDEAISNTYETIFVAEDLWGEAGYKELKKRIPKYIKLPKKEATDAKE